jgi:hypothetical protein
LIARHSCHLIDAGTYVVGGIKSGRQWSWARKYVEPLEIRGKVRKTVGISHGPKPH